VSATADWILLNGRVRTLDRTSSTSEALAVKGDRVVAVGSRDAIEALRGKATQTTDLEGSTVFPGFCDTHMHFQKIARELNMVHLDRARSIRDVLDAFRAAERSAPEGEWIRSFGDNETWHELNLEEGRLPLRAELDQAAPTHPVFLYRRPDSAMLNSMAISRLQEKLGSLSSDAWHEESGLVEGPGVRMLDDFLHREGAPSRERELELLAAASRRLLGMGITSIVDPGLAAGFAETWSLYQEARARGLVSQRLHLMNRIDYRRPLEEELERFLSSPVAPLEGDAFLHAWALKVFLDGEFENAWMRPDEKREGTPAQRYSVPEVEQIVDLCASRGWPLCMHVMGGAAIECAVAAVSKAAKRGHRLFPGQMSLAHAFLIRREDMLACRQLGISISVQPILAHLHDREMVSAWGEVAERANPLATMLEIGPIVAGGSDELPCEPLLGAYVAVTRQSWEGKQRGRQEALTPAQALALFTRAGGEYVCRRDQGSIAPGQVADFVVWPDDPLELNSEKWLELEPQLVAVAGAAVWSNGDFPQAS